MANPALPSILKKAKHERPSAGDYYPLTGTRFTDADTESSGNELQSLKPLKSKLSQTAIALVLLLLFSLVNFGFLFFLWRHLTLQQCPGTVTGLFPRVQYEHRSFPEEQSLIAPGPEADKYWADGRADGRSGHQGFVIIDDPDKFNLPAGQPYGDAFNKYGVTWAHQYHCLYTLREEFWKFIRNESDLVGVGVYDGTEQAATLWHYAHCYDYMRRHVECNMDMTLEWPTLAGIDEGHINGYEVTRTCKKTDKLNEYMDRHASDEQIAHTARLKQAADVAAKKASN